MYIPNVALILKDYLDFINNYNFNLKATVSIYHFIAKSKQSGINNDSGCVHFVELSSTSFTYQKD